MMQTQVHQDMPQATPVPMPQVATRAQSQNGTLGSAIVAAVLGVLVFAAVVSPGFADGISAVVVPGCAIVTVLFSLVVFGTSARRMRPISALLAAVGLVAGGFVVSGTATSLGTSISNVIQGTHTGAVDGVDGAATAHGGADPQTISAVLSGRPTAAQLANALQPMVMLLQSDHDSGRPYPSRLVVQKDGEVDPPSRLSIGSLPPKTSLEYHSLLGGNGFSLRLADAKDAHVSASYSTATGKLLLHGAG